jgi:hypothetical protein
MGLTVKGVPMNSSQQSTANALLAEGAKLQAGAIASQAIILAAIYENSISLGTYGGRIGPLSPLIGAKDSTGVPYAVGQSGIVQQAHDFFAGGGSFSSAMAKSRTTSDIVVVAEFAEGAEGQYETEAFPLSSGIAEAKAIVAAYGGTALAGGVAGLGGTGTAKDGSPSSTYPFVIGTTANPDEDYWTGTNRLAQEVNWYLFSNGEYMYYEDASELIGQTPALYLDRLADSDRILTLRGTYDNTAFEYVSDHKRKFHVQRKTKLTTITSPTEITMDLVCGIEEILGGDVIHLSSFGLMDGRWLVGDCTRSMFSVSSSITLVPPIAPLSEAQSAGTTGTKNTTTTILTSGSTVSGPIRQKILQIAQQAVALKAANYSAYMYDNQGDRFNYGRGVLAGPYPRTFDCSGFVTSVYRDAGAPDPGGSNYDNSETSDTIAAHCTQISASQAIPGDMVVFPEPSGHVVIYIGNGKCISQGGDSGPDVATVASEAAYNNRGIEGYYRCPGLL